MHISSTQCTSLQHNAHLFNTMHISSTQCTSLQHNAHLFNIMRISYQNKIVGFHERKCVNVDKFQTGKRNELSITMERNESKSKHMLNGGDKQGGWCRCCMCFILTTTTVYLQWHVISGAVQLKSDFNKSG
ncbi:hypothetical protein HELRODRAFT_165173 [Helobdella robusta]|uniref:Uncharacterized protein n=1 Tax=Helobdella robusta TaxID=6412 RepID=T1EWD5_HELRO|nr:hypothetical protein HELRODRAFT_165173 [Helobdella robusta]ESN93018.1 hypothetical protein HELRODRAFT_165173 [Helobdella robusta]